VPSRLLLSDVVLDVVTDLVGLSDDDEEIDGDALSSLLNAWVLLVVRECDGVSVMDVDTVPIGDSVDVWVSVGDPVILRTCDTLIEVVSLGFKLCDSD